MAIGTLYYSHSTARGEASFVSIPFHDASIEWNRETASTMSFKSPVKLEEADRIRYESDTRKFGGQIVKVKASATEDYDYEVISYLRLYHSKVTFSCKNMTASAIMRKILKQDANKLSTAGIQKTDIIHTSLKWSNTSIWDIALQLCYLEHKLGNDIGVRIDENGTMRFGYSLNNQEGYVFTDVIDYSEDYDSSDFITQYSVTYNGKVVASSSASNSLIAKWGVISETEDCTTSTSSSSSSTSSTTTTTTTSELAEKNIKKYNIESKIVKLAQQITNGKKSDKAKAKAIWDWMRSNIKYSYYACTRKNAKGTLSARAGNCADQTHLYMCLAYASGLEVRCNHINGHFFPQTKLNGKWFDTDTVTRRGWGGHWGNGGHWAYHYDPHRFNC